MIQYVFNNKEYTEAIKLSNKGDIIYFYENTIESN